MSDDPQRARALFLAALKLSESAARRDFLDRACAQDPALRQQVEALLGGHEATVGIGVEPSAPATPAPDGSYPPDERSGTFLAGRYQLIQEIGEGGMGSVWVAEQFEPVRRTVAVKLIKAGMDSKSVLARFDAERQALALMDHPNIAKVFDGGMTDQGRPYFVMEYVDGVPLTNYCDQARLSLRDRLRLFTSVCQAIQHAHQKGIIHRDLKPSNILVCHYDGKPVPKVIDFGLAKAMHQPLTDQSLHTAHGVLVGTPLYMSPEQAEPDNADVDTRTDIYSLGVILYELLTGSTPLEKQQLREAAFDEILRLIKEIEPPKPSTRLSGSASLSSIAALRSIDPGQLRKSLSGDLDWIAMKALEKERERRYESASGFARDVERYLNNEAVEACPPSRTYRLKKLLLRHKRSVAAGTVMAATLLVATCVSLWFAVNEARQRAEAVKQKGIAETNAENEAQARARAEAINKFVVKSFNSSDVLQRGKKDATIAEAMTNAVAELNAGAFKNDPRTEAELRDTIGVILKNNGKYDEAQELLEQAVKMRERVFGMDAAPVAFSVGNLGNLKVAQGDFPEAEVHYKRALAILEASFAADQPVVADALNNLATLYYRQGDYSQAEPLFARAMAIREKTLSPDDRDMALGLNDQALLLAAQQQYARAEELMKRSLAINEKALGPDHPDVAASLNSLAILYEEQGQIERAEPLYARALAICEKSLGPEHVLTADALHNLAELYRAQEKYEQAEPLFTRALAIREEAFGADDPQVAIILNNFGLNYKAQGKFTQAEPLYLRMLAIDEKSLGPEHAEVALDLNNLAALYQAQDLHAQAEPLYFRAVEIRKKLNPDDEALAAPLIGLARTLQALGKTAEARQAFDEAVVLLRRVSPKGSPLLARALWRSASAHLENGDAATALPELEESVAMAEKLLPAEHPQIAEYRETLRQCKAAIEDEKP